MMANFNSFGGGFGFIFYKIFAVLFLLGLLFFIVWALRNLKKDQLLRWAIGLMVVGIIGWIAASAFTGWHRGYDFGKSYKWMGAYGPMMMGGMMDCSQEEECHKDMEKFMDRMMGFDEEER